MNVSAQQFSDPRKVQEELLRDLQANQLPGFGSGTLRVRPKFVARPRPSPLAQCSLDSAILVP